MKRMTYLSTVIVFALSGLVPTWAVEATPTATPTPILTPTLTPPPVTGVTPTPTPSPAPTLNKGQTNIANSLATAQLAQYGITKPTQAQMNTALNGGTITVASDTGTKTVQLKGVLTQRAAGQGWGQIAHGMGLKLGKVVSATKANHHARHETKGHHHHAHHQHHENKHITHAGESTHHAKHSSKHVTTAAGASGGVYSRDHGKHHTASVTTAGGGVEAGRHEHSKRGAGIVTAAGGSYVATGHKGHQTGAGIVTASAGASSAGKNHADEGSKGKSGK